MSLKTDLHRAMLDMYQRAGREAGYWGNYFIRSVRTRGGYRTAKRMLRPLKNETIPKGLKALINAGQLDLSLEALVLKRHFLPLFSSREIAEAQSRIRRFHNWNNYWWVNNSSERYWVEIRRIEGIGKFLRCPLANIKGKTNPWYEGRNGDILHFR